MCGFIVLEKKEELGSQVIDSIQYRGPDSTIKKAIGEGEMIFHRLAIMGPDHSGDQPFVTKNESALVCNGEIYNYKKIKKELSDFSFLSRSDCEVIAPLIQKVGLSKACDILDGEYAFVFYDSKEKLFKAARDPMGIRPLFYGTSIETEALIFASEVKALKTHCKDIKAFKI